MDIVCDYNEVRCLYSTKNNEQSNSKFISGLSQGFAATTSALVNNLSRNVALCRPLLLLPTQSAYGTRSVLFHVNWRNFTAVVVLML